MRIKVAARRTYYKNDDGSLTVIKEETDEQAQTRFDDRQVSDALDQYEQRRDLEPLITLLLEANPGILRNPTALELLASAARGERRTGRGRVRTHDAIERDRLIASAARWLQELGMPLKNTPEKNRTGGPQTVSACRLIAEKINLSEDAVYSIVRKLKRKPLCDQYGINNVEITPWLIESRQPTPDEILMHYLRIDKKTTESELQSELWDELLASLNG